MSGGARRALKAIGRSVYGPVGAMPTPAGAGFGAGTVTVGAAGRPPAGRICTGEPVAWPAACTACVGVVLAGVAFCALGVTLGGIAGVSVRVTGPPCVGAP